MLLAIDIGNSNVVVGGLQDNRIAFHEAHHGEGGQIGNLDLLQPQPQPAGHHTDEDAAPHRNPNGLQCAGDAGGAHEGEYAQVKNVGMEAVFGLVMGTVTGSGVMEAIAAVVLVTTIGTSAHRWRWS